ncbi:hypothetical protein GCT13_13445 [Paraburkholderia sp. CNPSo 3157]|uniref:ASCH domain-containing protein n=1 Tax=Paraburkholderia franconis TaxID=2654983 RepID=A0A7X1N9L7_9BURK|nr:hypothetical protein [Paraburkholderia franconis]MPW17915.1 hypothetical protein [Paraburkholderia franconis]
MKERLILFSGPMVRALLDGRKTQTRRIVKPTGAHHIFQFRGTEEARGADEPTGEWAWCRAERVVSEHIRCPHGKPGDRLWVRETWAQPTTLDPGPTVYRADYPACVPAGFENVPAAEAITWKPSIHMPRALSRLTLEVTGVRVERLQDISRADAVAEGLIKLPATGRYVVNRGDQYFGGASHDSREVYADLWDRLNAARGFGWEKNPWVWVVEFKLVTLESE